MYARALIIGSALLLLAAGPSVAQTETGEGQELAGTGYFRDQDTLPGSYRLYLQQPKTLDWLWAMGPIRQDIRRSSFAADAHENVPKYSARSLCIDCHRNHTRDMHIVRMGITCVQCHRDKPIAGIYQYYSAMNPIRRHAYICAKCHEGATASFASYVVHEPNPLSLEAKQDFPLLFYGTWVMVILAGGVFGFFIPYVAVWGIRELVGRLVKGGPHHG